MTATAISPPIGVVLSKLEARQTGSNQWEACCPAHDDRSPSLGVSIGSDDQALLYCQAGCDLPSVLSALDLTEKDLWPANGHHDGAERPKRTVRYTYTDEAGVPLYDVVRTEPGRDGKVKAFHQEPANGKRGKGAMSGVRSVLYRLPEVIDAVANGQPVWIVEGEKDADAVVRTTGEVATCNPTGAGKWSKVPDAADHLAGADVIVWVDDDTAGHAHGRDVVASIDGKAQQWTVVRSATAKDAAEHLGAGRSSDELEVLAQSDGDRTWLDGEITEPEALDDEREPPPPALLFENVADVARRVDSAPPPKFLARPVWVEDAYGIIGAEDKAGKSWAALDLAVAVAAGGKWLDRYQCETPGPVLMFLGEGSDRKTIRRLRAVCEFHNTSLEHLNVRVCHRAPNLTRSDHLEAIGYELDAKPPRLVLLDPLYLSLGTTNSANLSEMGNVLGEIQHLCQRIGAALVVVHHWNQTGGGNDRKRFTGAGTAEWGRVLASIAIDEKRSTDGADSIVDQTWRFIGDEIPDTVLKVSRTVWAEDMDDLTSPMHYAVVATVPGPHVVADEYDRDHELRQFILGALASGEEMSGNVLADAIRSGDHKVRTQDVRRVARGLANGGPLRLRLGSRNAEMFRMVVDETTVAS